MHRVRKRGILGCLHTLSCTESGVSKPQGSLLSESTPVTDSYMLWCSIDLHDRECSTATVVRERSTHVCCLALRSPLSAAFVAQRLVHIVGGGRANRRHPARLAAEDRLDSSLSREVLDVVQVNATTEHDRVRQSYASIDTTLIPPGTQYGATLSKAMKGKPSKYAGFACPCKSLQHLTNHS
jgi:hypothetical protein